jgi:hypothetical protein
MGELPSPDQHMNMQAHHYVWRVLLEPSLCRFPGVHQRGLQQGHPLQAEAALV